MNKFEILAHKLAARIIRIERGRKADHDPLAITCLGELIYALMREKYRASIKESHDGHSR